MRDDISRILQRYVLRRQDAQRQESASPTGTIADLQRQLEQYQIGWPPGHFYSPIPCIAEVREHEQAIFGPPSRTIPGIDLNEEGQLRLLGQLKEFYCRQPFQDYKQPHLRYFFDNPNYSYGEAIVLFCIINLLKPKRIVEVGSGYSSCVILDTNEQMFQRSIHCTFVEPYPELLESLLKEEDRSNIRILPNRVQDVDPELFATLDSGDILFIDSSHVSKVGSDVNHIFFEILPRLAPGVYVHFHDIGYPFEYFKEWVYQGRAWNEAYLLRAFLQYNAAFRIEYFNDYMAQFHPAALAEMMPLCAKNAGTSIWLRRAG